MAWYEFLLLSVVLGCLCYGWIKLVIEENRFRRVMVERDRAITALCFKLIEYIDPEFFSSED